MKNLSIAFLAAASILTVGACKKKAGGDIGEAAAKVTEFKDNMCKCKDKACADKVQEDYNKWGQEMAKKMEGKKAEDVKVDEATTKKMTDAMTAYAECMTKATTADMAGSGSVPAGDMAGSAAPAAGSGDAGSAAPAVAGSDSTGIPECDIYRQEVEKLAKCDKMPEAARKAMKDGFDQAANAWKGLPAEAKVQAGQACKAAGDATKQAATASGC